MLTQLHFSLSVCCIILGILFLVPSRMDCVPVGDVSNSCTINSKESISTYLSHLKREGISLDNFTRPSLSKNIKLPFTGFIENLGQVSDDTIHYYYSAGGMSIGFGSSKINVLISAPEKDKQKKFSIGFGGAETVIPVGKNKNSYSINYFYGEAQFTNVPSYNEIWYEDLYPGIDLLYYMSAQGLKYDFIVHPGADSNQITIQISDPMVLSIKQQTVSFQSDSQPKHVYFQDTELHVFQADDMEIPAQFISKASHQPSYGFKIGSFDPSKVLIIDPLVLIFSTYLGGSGLDGGLGITLDAAENTYLTGFTTSTDFPTMNAFNNTHSGGSDVFVAKFDAKGNNLVFSTFIGGLSDEEPYSIAVDANGNSYVTGFTESGNFPVKNAYQGSHSGYKDVFVTKLNSTGNGLLFSTFLGGGGYDWAYGIALDADNNSYITGNAGSDFPTQNAYDSTYNGGGDTFVTKLNVTGGLNYSTYLGGSGQEWGNSITVDTTGNSYITGFTGSSNFPTKNAYDSTLDGNWDAFVTKLNATGNGLNYSTYLGGSDDEHGYGIAVDAAGSAYISGDTLSNNFPIKNAFNSTYSGTKDAFITKLNATGNGLNFSTYLGGNEDDIPESITVDIAGNSYVTGSTYSSNFPIYNAYDSTLDGAFDAFVTKLNATGNGLNYSTYLGGNAADWGEDIVLGPTDDCYIAGTTKSIDFSTYNAYDNTLDGMADAFITRLSGRPSIILNNPTNNSIHPSGITVDLDVTAIDGVSKVRYNWDGAANTTLGSPYDVILPASEGQHVLYVYANDTLDRWTKRVFIFTTDDTRPTITLTNPVNGTTHPSGTIIDLSIADLNGISHVLFNWDGGSNETLASPYDTPLITEDGLHSLRVYANDSAGHWDAAYYEFTTDDTPPTITLNSPLNGTTHQSGTIIDLTITGSNGTLIYHWDYAKNNFSVGATFDPILPSGDGLHKLYVYVKDTTGNWNTAYYEFITDDTPPTITLNSPLNGTTHQSGTIIDLTITGSNGTLIYHWDTDANSTVSATSDPILPSEDGPHILYIYVKDHAGNWAKKTYVFITGAADTTTTTTTPTTTTPTTTTNGIPTYFFTIEVSLLALVFLIVVFRRRKKRMIE